MKTYNNRLGMSALVSHPDKKTIEEQMEIFASVGFDSFFLSCGVTDEFEKIPYWSKYAKNIGIDFEAVHAPSTMVDSVWKGNEDVVTYEKLLKKILDFCSDGEIPKLVLHVGASPQIDVTQIGLEFWKKAEEYAKNRGVKLCYENANTPNLFEAVVSNADNFHGFCFDVGHQLCYTPEKDYATLYRKKLLYTHIHDNFGDGRDLHFLPKDGINDWYNYFSLLNKIGYTGTLNLELSCYHREDYRNMAFNKFVEHSYNRLVELIRE